MGNCYGAAVNDHSRNSSSSKLSSPDASTQKRKQRGDDEKRGTGDKADDKMSGNRLSLPAMKIFTLEELRTATRNFRMDSVLGEGGFGRVFKGWVDEKTYAPSRVGVGIPVAVKKAYPDHSYRHQEWQSEVKFLGRFSHPNLVRLLGFCWDDKEFLLVYEYMHKGSLENHLFRRGAEPLSWSRRFDIAVGAARGLAYLHNNSSAAQNQVIFRDFKPSNILLDSDFNAKISDFGLAKMGPADGDTHVSTRPKGTYGYAAPEYVATGHLYVKSDVYGFGVVLLELISGRRAIDPNRPHGELNLVEWATPLLCKKRKLKRIMDPRLEEEFPMEGAWEAAQLILRCLEGNPRTRPSMDQVLEDLLRISAIKLKRPKPVPLNPPRPTLHF